MFGRPDDDDDDDRYEEWLDEQEDLAFERESIDEDVDDSFLGGLF